jgi:hypothetical protein
VSKLRRSIPRSVKLIVEPVEIPSWPHLDEEGQPIINAETGLPECTYYVRQMTVKEKNGFNASVAVFSGAEVRVDYAKVQVNVLVRTLCDKDGVRLLEDNEVDWLEGQADGVLDDAFAVSQRLNNLGATNVKNS